MPIRPENRALYPADWLAISRRIREERAGGRCECDGRCGKPHALPRCDAVNGQRSPYTGSKVVLTTMHLNHDPTDCRDGNLMAGCQRCHLAYDQDHHAETRAQTHARELAEQMDPLFEVAP